MFLEKHINQLHSTALCLQCSRQGIPQVGQSREDDIQGRFRVKYLHCTESGEVNYSASAHKP